MNLRIALPRCARKAISRFIKRVKWDEYGIGHKQSIDHQKQRIVGNCWWKMFDDSLEYAIKQSRKQTISRHGEWESVDRIFAPQKHRDVSGATAKLTIWRLLFVFASSGAHCHEESNCVKASMNTNKRSALGDLMGRLMMISATLACFPLENKHHNDQLGVERKSVFWQSVDTI
jgi:hypothetical protein